MKVTLPASPKKLDIIDIRDDDDGEEEREEEEDGSIDEEEKAKGKKSVCSLKTGCGEMRQEPESYCPCPGLPLVPQQRRGRRRKEREREKKKKKAVAVPGVREEAKRERDER
ncbi:hypothetical protein TEQG_06656 [Trichophyton equinum CBS 127.97]|uniref:Uncharacterized protein n=1 Tax=Trichophyton equinum (strain ATCC MYA-4606 / CBS 127.97) TaxID=559882 RepID=F2Q0K4_TRIEC|nr:hypothetical protein TEQG_06656 [Trichophyton equinum CBS 127.97]